MANKDIHIYIFADSQLNQLTFQWQSKKWFHFRNYVWLVLKAKSLPYVMQGFCFPLQMLLFDFGEFCQKRSFIGNLLLTDP